MVDQERDADATPALAGRQTRWAGMVAVAWFVGVVALSVWVLAPSWRVAVASSEPTEDTIDATAVAAAESSTRRVHGRVLLEDEEALLREDAQRLSDGADGLSVAAPTAGSCQIGARRDGSIVAGPTPCDDDGRFLLELTDVGPGPLVVEYLVPGRLRGHVEIVLDDALEIELPTVALGLGHEVSGQVVDRSGAPIAGVEITARPKPDYGEAEPWRVRSDVGGAFRLDTLPVGPVTLRAHAPGHAPTVMEAVAPEAGVLLMLDRLVQITGRVTAAEGRELSELSAMTVAIEGSSVWPARRRDVEPDGQFVFDDLPAGIYAVEAIAVDASGREFATVPLHDVSAGVEIALPLQPAFGVRVQVVDPAGQPIAGARVSVGDADLGVLARRGETDANGYARLGSLVPGGYWARAFADGFLAPDPVAVDIVSADESVALTLARPARIEGTVRDGAGRPIADAQVVVEGDDGLGADGFDAGQHDSQRELFRLARRDAGGSLGVTSGKVPGVLEGGEQSMDTGGFTNAAGRFVVDLLPGGRYQLFARHPAYADGERVSVHVAASSVRRGVELILGDGFPITGRVRDDNDQAVAHARVEIGDVTVWTDDRGVFEAGLWRGTQALRISKVGYTPRVVTVRAMAPGVDVAVRLSPSRGRVFGRVHDGNGQPIAEVAVSLAMRDAVSATRGEHTDARGLFSFERVPGGPGELRLSHDDYLTRTIDIDVDADATLREYELARAHAVDVLVRDGSGRPVRGALITGGQASVRTDHAGRATILGVPGSASLRVTVEAEGMVANTIEVDRTRPEWIVDLIDGGALEGEITDDIGDPLVGATVVVHGDDGRKHQARTSRDGTFRVEGVAVGDVRIDVRPPRSRDDLVAQTVASDVREGLVTRDVQVRLERRE